MTVALAQAFVDLLKADAGVVALVAQRIFPDRAPDNTPEPYVVWSEVVSAAEESHDDSATLDATDAQFSCYATDRLLSLQVRKAVRAALTAPGALDLSSVKVIKPIVRGLYDDEALLANSVLEITFMHNPSA